MLTYTNICIDRCARACVCMHVHAHTHTDLSEMRGRALFLVEGENERPWE